MPNISLPLPSLRAKKRLPAASARRAEPIAAAAACGYVCLPSGFDTVRSNVYTIGQGPGHKQAFVGLLHSGCPPSGFDGVCSAAYTIEQGPDSIATLCVSNSVRAQPTTTLDDYTVYPPDSTPSAPPSTPSGRALATSTQHCAADGLLHSGCLPSGFDGVCSAAYTIEQGPDSIATLFVSLSPCVSPVCTCTHVHAHARASVKRRGGERDRARARGRERE